jgi:hypothetical protein
MIQTITDLKYYRKRDWQRYNTTMGRYLIGFFLGEESSRCIRYLRILRNTEYHFNNRHISLWWSLYKLFKDWREFYYHIWLCYW